MLQSLLIYLLKVVIISGMLLLYYNLALRNKRFHYYNRFYLLFTVLLSVTLPLLHLQWFILDGSSSKAIHIFSIINSSGEEDFIVNGNKFFNWEQTALIAISTISFILLCIAVYRINNIYKIKRKYDVTKTSEFDFINTDLQTAPFSFLKNIFWRNDLKVDDAINQQILQHEISHVQQKHSWDKLFIQFTLCFYWMNPFFWWLQKEVNLIHEFIADEKAVEHNDAESFAKMLLAAHYGKFQFYPAQSIFYSPIKRRLIMLTTSKKPQLSYLRRIMVLPLIACVVCLFAFKLNEQKTIFKTAPVVAAANFKLVVDAGHGGKDYGAANDDLYEKDIALKIAEKIKTLSPQYGIDVVLTRDKDVFMSPKEKSDFANSQNANAFVSIHVNNATKEEQKDESGIEVYLGTNEQILDNSKVLGSAILQNLQTDFKVLPSLQQQQIGIRVLKNSTIPAALIECGYMSNENDIKILKDDAKIELMAKNILQGVTMYANNKVDTTNLYKIQSRDESKAIQSANSEKGQRLYVIQGTEEQIKNAFNSKSGEFTANELTGKNATDRYGDKGKNGVVEINLKSDQEPQSNDTVPKKIVRFSPPVIVRDSDNVANPSKIPADKVFTQVQQPPSFPGGSEGWRKFLETSVHANTPADKGAPPGKYTVTVSFVVDQDGKVSDVKAVKDPGFGTGQEAVRAIAQGPNWNPAVQNSRKVVCSTKQNITFQVTEQ